MEDTRQSKAAAHGGWGGWGGQAGSSQARPRWRRFPCQRHGGREGGREGRAAFTGETGERDCHRGPGCRHAPSRHAMPRGSEEPASAARLCGRRSEPAPHPLKPRHLPPFLRHLPRHRHFSPSPPPPVPKTVAARCRPRTSAGAPARGAGLWGLGAGGGVGRAEGEERVEP